MSNQTQLARYKKLLAFIDAKFREDINIDKVEEISHYSYRNINRIFSALHHETIGKYINRIRLEKAAEYLKFSKRSISDIAFEIGFKDIAAFSKAFKKKFNCSPSNFRNSSEVLQAITRQAINPQMEQTVAPLQYEIDYLADFEMLYLEHRGSYENIAAIKNTWTQFVNYLDSKNLLSGKSIFFAEVLDDNEIAESINCRYNVALILDKAISFEPEGMFLKKKHTRQKYAKFIHKGSHESCHETYDKIYAHWMTDIQLEFKDLPTLEFFLNDEVDTPPEELLTEIYIPVV